MLTAQLPTVRRGLEKQDVSCNHEIKVAVTKVVAASFSK
jgi:hypothetical protein